MSIQRRRARAWKKERPQGRLGRAGQAHSRDQSPPLGRAAPSTATEGGGKGWSGGGGWGRASARAASPPRGPPPACRLGPLIRRVATGCAQTAAPCEVRAAALRKQRGWRPSVLARTHYPHCQGQGGRQARVGDGSFRHSGSPLPSFSPFPPPSPGCPSPHTRGSSTHLRESFPTCTSPPRHPPPHLPAHESLAYWLSCAGYNDPRRRTPWASTYVFTYTQADGREGGGGKGLGEPWAAPPRRRFTAGTDVTVARQGCTDGRAGRQGGWVGGRAGETDLRPREEGGHNPVRSRWSRQRGEADRSQRGKRDEQRPGGGGGEGK